ncbi:MAG: AzlD domain-containing protein [Actinobacteria bacterium]|nr:AzlD domain-containing protein [Actinomycetota bacterium]
MIVIVTFVAAAAVTYLLRSSMVLAGDRLQESDGVRTAVELTAPAVLAAMIAGALLVHHGTVSAPALAEVAAIGAAVVAVRRTGNVGAALAAGLPVYWVIQALAV